MTEVWLHSNRRILMLAMVPTTLLGALGTLMFLLELPTFVQIIGGVVAVVACLLLLGLCQQLLRHRITHRPGFVCFYLKSGKPIEVPIHIVEAFFLGQGPAHLPGADQDRTKTVNLVVRLSQRETDWAERDVKEALGSWKEGYITIRGTWCEPLTKDVIHHLNSSLSQASKAAAAESKEPTQ